MMQQVKWHFLPMSGRSKVEEPPSGSAQQEKIMHERVIHHLALTIFSDNGVESAGALNELLRWSTACTKDFPMDAARVHRQKLLYPSPTPILIQSLARYLSIHMKAWTRGPSTEPALTAIAILNNIANTSNAIVNVNNAHLIASCPEAVTVLHRISYHPQSPLAAHALQSLQQIGRFCDIQHIFGDNAKDFAQSLCSTFLLASPSKDEPHVIVFLSFMLLPDNCHLFLEIILADQFITRVSELLYYPSTPLRDMLLETLYTITLTNSDIKDAACVSPLLLRSILRLAIPYSLPHDGRHEIPFVPCQKACVFLLELCSDSRAMSYLAQYRQHFAYALTQWKSSGLTELALKVSNSQ